MDVDVDPVEKKQALLQEQGILRAWLNHPLARDVLDQLATEENAAVDLLCNRTPNNLETFLAHFECIGQLRSIRHLRQLLSGRAEELEEELKEQNQ